MTESFYTHIELGHVPCPEIEQFIYDDKNHIIY
ncbi:Uncharacterised protein [Vibrio alginolyticus]|nr:hypothetical protein XM68_c12677 [Vibrio alginolyticus]SQA43706.1 Uncharacterised protein [Vibrio alginolyticus]